MSQDCDSYFGDCCGSDCGAPPGAVSQFDLVLSAFPPPSYQAYLVWSGSNGAIAALKPGRWAWTMEIAGATADSRGDDVLCDVIAGGPPEFVAGHWVNPP